jgi:hypothetical protein
VTLLSGCCMLVLLLFHIMEQCSLLLPLRWGAGPMALLLWLEWVT